ncbi:SCO5918 family protein [Yinghuangia seranimata]|nr:SCO5918 family protein [Yinghuangia seranimata]MDI2128359.1 SCO5918 family protein [Yinghuangia seranimata]
MRVVIAGVAFDFDKNEVERLMKGVEPEPVTGAAVVIGQTTFPVMQVGEVITGQSRRDFSSRELTQALSRLGFTS